MPEMEVFHPHRHIIRRPPGLRLDPLIRRHLLEEQVELWWFREPRRSLLCYLASVALILGLGLGGVGLLATATSLSGEWRLGVGTALCLLALAVLLKQLLSSAVQDMNCVHSRQRIEQLKSGGSADPALMAAVGLALLLCGVALLYVSTTGTWHGGQDQDRDRKDMFLSGLVLMAVGGGMSMAISGYTALLWLQRRRRREEERQRWMRRRRQRDARRMESRAVRVFSVSGGQGDQARRDASSSRTSLI